MSNQQWQEGKTYRFKPDMIEKFASLSFINRQIVNIIDNNTFKVETIGYYCGRVISISGVIGNINDLTHWFFASEIKYFDLVEATVDDSNNIRPNVDIVVEFLDKLHYVMDHDNSVDKQVCRKPDSLSLTTDFSDIRGSNNIYTFITNRYELLQQEAKYKKNNDLMERKAKLEAELAEVNKELGNV